VRWAESVYTSICSFPVAKKAVVAVVVVVVGHMVRQPAHQEIGSSARCQGALT